MCSELTQQYDHVDVHAKFVFLFKPIEVVLVLGFCKLVMISLFFIV